MPHRNQPLSEFHQPATFRSRGVAAHFTTPSLAGALVRGTERAFELVLGSPSGGRGLYVLTWPGVSAFCEPTVYDTMLCRRMAQCEVIDPSNVRSAALQVAAEGYAGREAAAAADAAMADDRSQRLDARLRLVTRLLEQLDPTGSGTCEVSGRKADFDRRCSAILHELAASIGRTTAGLAGDLSAISDAFAPLGTSRSDRGGRIPRVIARMEYTLADLLRWTQADPRNDIDGLCGTVTIVLRAVIQVAETVLQANHHALADPATLLRLWIQNSPAITDMASRCDWLLDGWERVCLLWTLPKTFAAQRAALLEMAMLLPVLPREVQDWIDVPLPPDVLGQTCRVSSVHDTWRNAAAAITFTERNEKLRAMSA